jgi:hypothetical protein
VDDLRLTGCSGGVVIRDVTSGAVPASRRNPRLSPDQVRAIRALAGLATTTEIARRTSAGSARQVRNVVVERTYRSIR